MSKLNILHIGLLLTLILIFAGSPDYLSASQPEAPAFISTASTQDVVLAVAGMT